MFIVTCSPLVRNSGKEPLSYFSKQDVPLGSLIKVPLRGRNVSAIVLEVSPLVTEKQSIKEASFSLKKLSSIRSSIFYFKETVEAAKKTADFFYTNPGTILSNYTPSPILEFGHDVKINHLKQNSEFELLAFQGTEEERILEYKGIIREYFAQKKSIFICFPTSEDLMRFKNEISRGIDNYTFSLGTIKSEKESRIVWKNALKEKHSVLILGTPSSLSIPRSDLGLIILEKESSRFYKTFKRPYSDARVFAENLAQLYKIPCLFADTALRVETTYRIEKLEINRLAQSKMRITTTANCLLIDMKKEKSDIFLKNKESQEVLSREAINIIENSFKKNERIFLFTVRRGISSITICNDCKTIVECRFCNSPVVLHEAKEPYFLCHHCGKRRDAKENCRACNSWDLRAFGIGIEKVAETVQKLFPETPLHIVSKDTVSTGKKAHEIIDKFMKTGGILIGTEMTLPYLHKKIESCIVVSLDSLFALPDFKIQERIFSIIQYIRERSKLNFLLQTRQAYSLLLQNALRGDYSSYYREELENRQIFKYPPFETLIKFSIEGKKEDIVAIAEPMIKKEDLGLFEIFPVFTPGKKGLILTAILRKSKNETTKKLLSEYIKTLPPSIKVDVAPESIL